MSKKIKLTYEQTKAKNIYDLVGNLWEWTTESYNTTDQAFRGSDHASELGGNNDSVPVRVGRNP